MRCDQELCPFWDGHGCPCVQLDIPEADRLAAKQDLEGFLDA